MGALLSQAVANQLRQVPQFQDPRPSPPVLLQQVLNPPGPQESMRGAGMMEQNQLLQLSMDPSLTPAWKEAVNNALNKSMLNTALAFGGADITKEQRLAWEAENQAYRRGAGKEHQWASDVYKPGTRVSFKPVPSFPGRRIPPNEHGDTALGEGVVVDPASPDAGPPAYQPSTEATRRKPSPDHIAVRGDYSGHWFWRHRDSVEVLPPREEFPVGTKVEYVTLEPGVRPGVMKQPWVQAQVSEPPKGSKPPGPDYVWVDYEADPELNLRHPFGGGWYHKSDLMKKK